MGTKRRLNDDGGGTQAASAASWINWRTQTRRSFRRGFISYGAGADAGVAERTRLGIQVLEDPSGEEATPAPLESFEQLGVLPPWLLEALREGGQYEPSALEAQSLPIVIAGQNLLALTGSPAAASASKCAASYLLPGAVHVQDQLALSAEEPGPVVLILTPSQDHANAVTAVASSLLQHSADGAEVKGHVGGLRAVNVSGGGLRSDKMKELGDAGAHFVVGTPKRVHDMASKEQLSLLRVTFLVIDGLDKMLDLGFIQELRDLGTWIRPERQTVLLATASRMGSEAMMAPVTELCYSGGDPVTIKLSGGKSRKTAGKEAAEEFPEEW